MAGRAPDARQLAMMAGDAGGAMRTQGYLYKQVRGSVARHVGIARHGGIARALR